MVEPSFQKVLLAVLSISVIAILVSLHYYINKKKIVSGLIMRVTHFRFSTQAVKFSAEKITGFILFGLVPFILFVGVLHISPVKIGLTSGKTGDFWYLLLLMPVVAGFLSFISSKSKENWKISPPMQIKDWHLRHLLLSASGWLIYLVGYEFMLRGILWFLCTNAFGFWPALVINIFLYMVIHIPKGFLMTIGTIPAGVIFCVLTYISGSLFLALITHASIAISNDIFSVQNNPELKFILKKNKVNQ